MSSEARIVSVQALKTRAEQLRATGKRLVLAVGAFDLPHVGHLHFLQNARAAGDALAVLLLSDESVRRARGEGRPIMQALQRARVAAGLQCVDLVALAEDQISAEVVGGIGAALLALGPEGQPWEPAGGSLPAGEVRVLRLPGTPGVSTSQIIERIRANQARA